jgi:hypothetical protein
MKGTIGHSQGKSGNLKKEPGPEKRRVASPAKSISFGELDAYFDVKQA